jgi:dihydrofolate synthase / folylpolyglutamate synthase
MNYQQTIDYLYDALPMFSRIGSAAFKKDLGNTLLLCERLGNPQDQFKSIHVAGTNGKGSVSHMLAAILQTSGYKTGLYTSPHLYDFRERIKVNGTMCDKDFVVDFVRRIKPAIEEIQPSFFEITVAMAFDYFVQQEVDIAIIEVGLGGRLDSTNVITPELSIITNIGWDHMNLLGNTLPKIAFEKAGIIKQGVPVVIGEKKPETEGVFRETTAGKNAPIYFAEENFTVENYKLSVDSISISVKSKDQSTSEYHLDLPGIYQAKNLLTVLQAIDLLPKWRVSREKTQYGLMNAKRLTGLNGRWEVIHRKPTVVLEVAHNKDGIEEMLHHLNNTEYERLHIVLGSVKDKDPVQVLQLLPKKAKYYFTEAHIPRALNAEVLQFKASEFGLEGYSYDDVNLALQQALTTAAVNDFIIVCGSIFLVGEVNRELITQQA